MASIGGSDVFISKLDSNGNFVWAKQMGGALNNQGISISVDTSGNVYTTGYFLGTVDFDPGVDTFDLTSAGGFDIFISKLDSSGNFIWAKQIGGTDNDFGQSITTDNSGNAYITGCFIGVVDFDTDTSTYTMTSINYEDIFVLKLNTNGQLVWAKKAGGPSGESGYSIKTDASGNVFTAGSFTNTVDFNPADTLTYYLSTNGNQDIFILKLDSSGNFAWAKQFGGIGSDYCKSIFVDELDNVYTTGYFVNTVDFDPDTSTYNFVAAGGSDIFVSKLDSLGTFVWVKQFSGTFNEIGKSIAVDSSGSVFTCGVFSGMVDFDPDTTFYNLTSAGMSDIYISKLDSSGNLLWAKQFGNMGDDKNNAIALDPHGNIYSTGGIQFTVDLDPSSSVYTITSIGASDAYIQKISPCKMTYSTVADTACGSYLLNGITITTSGVYYDTLINLSGCDSLITINLVINPLINTILTDTACSSYNFNGTLLTTSGIYYDTLTSISGCDSTIMLNLFVYTFDTTVTLIGTTLIADVPGPSYQWVDCDNAYAAIPGETNQSFTPAISGNYAVILTQNMCSDTSSCYNVSLVGIEDPDLSDLISIKPNPSSGKFIIDISNTNLKIQRLEIFNMIGAKVFSANNPNNYEINISDESEGVYFVHIKTENINYVGKLILQH